MKAITSFLDNINEWSGRIFAWSTAFLVLLIFAEVVLRYLFNRSIIFMVELEIYFFAFSFLFASGYAFKHEQHVRVDLFYDQKSARSQAWTNLLGGVFFLLPWTIIAIIGCFKYAAISWNIGEVSQQPGGLPAVYLLKFSLVIGFSLLLLQGVSSILKSLMIIFGAKEEQV